MEAIGFLELNSIAKGVETADTVLKTADVRLLSAKPGCPGKYYLLFTGRVSAVQASLDAGRRTGGDFVVDGCIIPHIHPDVVSAVNMTSMPTALKSVGIMEYYSVTAAIYSADAAVKAADVELIEVRTGTGIGGKSFVILTGDVAAVREAVRCGVATPNAEGMLISEVVIPSPHPDLLEALL